MARSDRPAQSRGAVVVAGDAWWPLAANGEEFKALIERRASALAEEVLEAVAAEVPEVIGPSPQLRELYSEVITANLENFAAAIAYRVPVETAFEPPSAVEHARLLAQRGVTSASLLLGYQVVQRSLMNPVIEAVETFVEDRDELVRTIEAVLGHMLVQANGASRVALRTHALAHDAWMRGRGAGLSKRLDAVLDRVVTDPHAAERALNYAMSGKHVAFVAWIDDPEAPLDMSKAERTVAELLNVRDTLLVARDERTLYGWLHVADDTSFEQWLTVARRVEDESRIAFGEVEEGLEGFRLSHLQARSVGAVIAASRERQHTMVLRYRDVASLCFLVDRQVEANAWAHHVLGDLGGPGEDCERLRQTLCVFLDEGGNAIATGEKLFVHRNTVKYRVDKALSLLPGPLGTDRVEVALALRYADWVGV
jgi:hypothetical protein